MGQGSNHDTLNLRQENQGWNYYRDRYRDMTTKYDGDWRRKDDIRGRVDCIFHQGTVMLTLRWNHFSLR